MNEEVVAKRRGRKLKNDNMDLELVVADPVVDEQKYQLEFKYKGALIYDVSVSYHIFPSSIYIFKIDCIVNRKPYPFLRMAGNIGRRKCKNLFDGVFKSRHKGMDITYSEDLQSCLILK